MTVATKRSDELGHGDLVRAFGRRWQWEDGASALCGTTVDWSFTFEAFESPDHATLTTAFVARAEPDEYWRKGKASFPSILRSGPLTVAFDSRTPLVGHVRVQGLIVPDWYDRTSPWMPMTRATIEELHLVTADIVSEIDITGVVPDSIELTELSRLPLSNGWKGPSSGAAAQIGVLISLRLVDPAMGGAAGTA